MVLSKGRLGAARHSGLANAPVADRSSTPNPPAKYNNERKNIGRGIERKEGNGKPKEREGTRGAKSRHQLQGRIARSQEDRG